MFRSLHTLPTMKLNTACITKTNENCLLPMCLSFKIGSHYWVRVLYFLKKIHKQCTLFNNTFTVLHSSFPHRRLLSRKSLLGCRTEIRTGDGSPTDLLKSIAHLLPYYTVDMLLCALDDSHVRL